MTSPHPPRLIRVAQWGKLRAPQPTTISGSSLASHLRISLSPTSTRLAGHRKDTCPDSVEPLTLLECLKVPPRGQCALLARRNLLCKAPRSFWGTMEQAASEEQLVTSDLEGSLMLLLPWMKEESLCSLSHTFNRRCGNTHVSKSHRKRDRVGCTGEGKRPPRTRGCF